MCLRLQWLNPVNERKQYGRERFCNLTEGSRMERRQQHFSRTGAIVDLAAIRSNMESLAKAARSVNPDIGLLATVKADAYGHGACEVANALAGTACMYSVACIDEGIELRTAGGIKAPILILGPVFAGDDEDTFRYGLTQTVFTLERAKQLNDNAALYDTERKSDPDEIKARARAEGDKAGEIVALLREDERKRETEQNGTEDPGFDDGCAHVHIAVDTGMSRIGLTPDEGGLAILREICSMPNIRVDGIFTHFATADESDKTEAMKALDSFRRFRVMAEEAGIRIPIWHCANTASIIDGIGLEGFEMARAGIGLYGMYPSEEVQKENVLLTPALTWYAYITHVKEIEAGTSVSYGYRFTADRRMRIGTVCIGYADGYPRSLSLKGTEVLVNGRRCPILGRICMDQMMIDLSSFAEGEIFPGVPVILLGAAGQDKITAEELADRYGTINYEITCNISRRVPRKYINR